MPTLGDWVPAATAAIGAASAAVGSWLGYLGAQRLATSEAERQRLALSRDSLARRATSYQEFLHEAHRFYNAVTLPTRMNAERMNEQQLAEWFLAVEKAVVAVQLFGTPDVKDGAERLYKTLSEATSPSFEQAFLADYGCVVAAMRADVQRHDVRD